MRYEWFCYNNVRFSRDSDSWNEENKKVSHCINLYRLDWLHWIHIMFSTLFLSVHILPHSNARTHTRTNALDRGRTLLLTFIHRHFSFRWYLVGLKTNQTLPLLLFTPCYVVGIQIPGYLLRKRQWMTPERRTRREKQTSTWERSCCKKNEKCYLCDIQTVCSI